MNGRIVLKGAFGAVAGAALLSGVAPAQAEEAATVSEAIEGGKLIFQVRPRYEHVDQSGIDDADAYTMRTRLGWETASFHGFKGLIEFEDVRAGGDYNDGVAPTEPFASVSDPEVTELNRAQLAWTINPHYSVTLGRQSVSFDDGRFIDPSNWRQDSVTQDGARFDMVRGKFKATYFYADHINRSAAEAADWDSQSHLLNASYAFSDAFKLTGFYYGLDFENSLANSVEIQGVRATGKFELGSVKLDYAASYANEQDYGDNPNDIDLNYNALMITATHGIISARLSREELEGDGARGFLTPLGSGHSFHGWAGVFSTRPANGLIDTNASVTVSPEWELPFISDVSFMARYYDFETERTGVDLGEEWDFQAGGTITEHLSLTLKYGNYDGNGSPADTTRTMLYFEYKL